MKRLLYYFMFILLILMDSMNIYAFNKIAVVNISTVFQEMPDFHKSIKKLENEFKGRVEKLKSMEKDLQKKLEYLKNNYSNIKINERKELEKSLFLQKEIFSNSVQSLEQENYFRQQEEKDKIIKKILNLVEQIAKKEGYNLVIDSNAIAYIDVKKDITDKVLNIVR